MPRKNIQVRSEPVPDARRSIRGVAINDGINEVVVPYSNIAGLTHALLQHASSGETVEFEQDLP